MGGCLDLRNVILSSTAGYEIKYLPFLTNSTCNEWTYQCVVMVLFGNALSRLCCMVRTFRGSLVRITSSCLKCSWHLKKGQSKLKGRSRDGADGWCWGKDTSPHMKQTEVRG